MSASGLYYPQTLPRPTSNLVGTWSPEALGNLLDFMGPGNIGSAVWPAANRAYAVPFVLTEPKTALTMWAANGAANNGNIDLGIYDANFARLVSKGATAQTPTSDLQKLDITDTALQAGVQYFMALSCSSGTAEFQRFLAAAGVGGELLGYYQMAAAHPLPATFVPATPTNYLPLFGLSFVAVY